MKCNLLIFITVNWRTTGSMNLIIWTKKKVLNLQFSIISPLCACMNTCILRTVVFVFIEKYCIYRFHCRYKLQYFFFFLRDIQHVTVVILCHFSFRLGHLDWSVFWSLLSGFVPSGFLKKIIYNRWMKWPAEKPFREAEQIYVINNLF